MKTINVGLIGCGFMGRTHSNAHRRLGNFFKLEHQTVLKAICDFNEEKAKAFALTWGFESVETDWRKLIAREDIDLIEIAAPNNLHAEIAVAAAKAGKMIICEKPLAMDGKQGLAMVKAVEKAGVPNLVSYNYRRIPAVTLAKNLIDEGRLGRIFHYRAKFLQDWTISKDLPQGRRLVAAGCQSRRQWCHRRSAGALHRHCLVVERRYGSRQRHDRNLHQGTET